MKKYKLFVLLILSIFLSGCSLFTMGLYNYGKIPSLSLSFIQDGTSIDAITLLLILTLITDFLAVLQIRVPRPSPQNVDDEKENYQELLEQIYNLDSHETAEVESVPTEDSQSVFDSSDEKGPVVYPEEGLAIPDSASPHSPTPEESPEIVITHINTDPSATVPMPAPEMPKPVTYVASIVSDIQANLPKPSPTPSLKRPIIKKDSIYPENTVNSGDRLQLIATALRKSSVPPEYYCIGGERNGAICMKKINGGGWTVYEFEGGRRIHMNTYGSLTRAGYELIRRINVRAAADRNRKS